MLNDLLAWPFGVVAGAFEAFGAALAGLVWAAISANVVMQISDGLAAFWSQIGSLWSSVGGI